MLSNLYVIPKVVGEEVTRLRIQLGSNYADIEYPNEIPQEILESISEDEKEWMDTLHASMEYRRYRKRFVEINRELEKTQGIEKRSPLVREAGALLDELKAVCT